MNEAGNQMADFDAVTNNSDQNNEIAVAQKP